jgi:hypothetical protein
MYSTNQDYTNQDNFSEFINEMIAVGTKTDGRA